MPSPIQTNFTAGELSPSMYGRGDLQKYYNGARTLENFRVDPLGGIHKCGGLRYVADAASTGIVRLIPFIYSSEQAYALEFSDGLIRFFMDHGQILSGGVAYSIASPYDGADLFGIQWAQSHDVMYLFHPSYAPRKLSRLAHDSWTLEEIPWSDGPYLDENTTSKTITPDATTGTVWLTASSSLFASGHVGSLWRLRHNGAIIKQIFTAGAQNSSAARLYGYFSVDITPDATDNFVGRIVLQKSVDAGTTWQNVASFHYNTKEEFFEGELDVQYRLSCPTSDDFKGGSATGLLYQDEAWGVVEITDVSDSTHARGEVKATLGGTTATARWAEGAWSTRRGFPRAGCFFQNRLWAAGTTHQPQTLWASWAGDYENFMPEGDTDDAAISYTLLSHQTSAIQWVLPQRSLVAGTLGSEWQVTGGADGKPITATNVSVLPHTNKGSAQNISPVRVGPGILFVQGSRRRVLELSYSFERDSLVAPDLTLLADHLTETYGIRDMAYQQEPYSTLWCVRSDGVLLGCAYYRQEEVVAWFRRTTDGLFRSVCAIPSSMGTSAGEDELWTVVLRDGRQTIEVMESNKAAAYPLYLDSALTYSGTAVTTISGLAHLANRHDIYAVGDGAVYGPLSVSDAGVLTMPRACSRVDVGLTYTAIFSSLPFELSDQRNSSQLHPVRVSELAVRFKDTSIGKFGKSLDDLDVIPFRTSDHLMGSGPTPASQVVRLPFSGNSDLDPQVFLVQEAPLPMSILSVLYKVVA